MKLLLHACCGPCSLEPVRLLRERGAEITIVYANANIAPEAEYQKRLHELQGFAASQGIRVIEAPYRPQAWEETAGKIGEELAGRTDIFDFTRPVETVAELLDDKNRQARCRACYRQRLREAALIAKEQGFGTLSTTLAVSPYQFTDVIREELELACSDAGLEPFFEDWRPYYDNATARSRAMGMYRQNYCGCRFSVTEGEATRQFIAHRKKQRKAAERAAHAGQAAAEEAARKEQAAQREAYNRKQERKHAVLKQLRQQAAGQAAAGQEGAPNEE